MNDDLPEKIDLPFLKILQDVSAVDSFDDLFEAILSLLLKIRHVRQAEIYLLNRQDKLVPVANGKNSGPKGGTTQEIRTQSWIVDSTVRHSTRRVSVPNIFLTHSIPLVSSGEPLGLLNVQMDQIATVGNDLMVGFYLIGMQLSAKIKHLMLDNDIVGLNSKYECLMADNRENQLQITSLSKELYAISAISTKINQSMDLKKSLHKSMLKIKEVFKSSGVLVFLKNPKGSKPRISSFHIEDDPLDPALLKKIENIVLQNFIGPQQFPETSPGLRAHQPKKIDLHHDKFGFLVGTPMKSQKKTIGALIILHANVCTFNQDDLRLLSGIANIMGLAVENMNLYRQSQQKKKETAFLINSMSTFNQKLDLEKTLTAVVKKSAEFIGAHCRVYLFSETKIPMIQYTKKLKTFDRIQPKAIKVFYKQMILQKRPFLMNDIGRSHTIGSDMKSFFDGDEIRSLLAVPLRLTHKPLGLLLLGTQARGRKFDFHDIAVAEALGAAASVAIENARAYTASVDMSEFFERKISEKTSEIEKIQERQKIRVENRKDIIFRINKQGRFVFVNKAMENLTGCSREELYQEEIKAQDVVAGEDRKRIRDAIRQMLNGDHLLIRDLEYRHLNRRGEDHYISLTIYPEKDQLGRIKGVEGVGRDITEKKRLETEIEKTKDLALLGEFSSAIAHQIRNPLGNILMGTKLLQKAVGLSDTPPEGRSEKTAGEGCGVPQNQAALTDIFNNLSDGIYNLNQVVTELVEYTKTLKLSRSRQRIETILAETLMMLKDVIDRNAIRLKKKFAPDLPPLSVDAVLIGQVFQNIVHNAIQAMPSGGCLTVTTSLYAEKPGYVLISISDTGSGVAPNDFEKIFHPFYTTKAAGTGLGLSLAHRIIDAHHGRVWVCQNPCAHTIDDDTVNIPGDPPDRGVTFHILLPLGDQTHTNGSTTGESNDSTDPIGG
jgi:PAS domain S-box-containing protein